MGLWAYLGCLYKHIAEDMLLPSIILTSGTVISTFLFFKKETEQIEFHNGYQFYHSCSTACNTIALSHHSCTCTFLYSPQSSIGSSLRPYPRWEENWSQKGAASYTRNYLNYGNHLFMASQVFLHLCYPWGQKHPVRSYSAGAWILCG